jgi:two-component system chemotaxis response regulator CheB
MPVASALRVLVVEDSPRERESMVALLRQTAVAQVVGEAADGEEALRLALTHEPDVITLDLDLPRLNGFHFLRLLMAKRPTPVIVVSHDWQRGSVFKALELGALDFVAKPSWPVDSGVASSQVEAFYEQLLQKIGVARHARLLESARRTSEPPPPSSPRALGSSVLASARALTPAPSPIGSVPLAPAPPPEPLRRPATLARASSPPPLEPSSPRGPSQLAPLAPAADVPRRSSEVRPPPSLDRGPRDLLWMPRRVIAVAASTGGPNALLELVQRLDPGLDAAMLIAQHMPERFTRSFAQRLDRLGRMRVSEASDGEPVRRGCVYLCPGGRSMQIARDQEGTLRLRVVPAAPNDRYAPSADRLFESVAKVCGRRAVGVVLSGMGTDGAAGARAIAGAGGSLLVESPDSAVVFGMPSAVLALRIGAESGSVADVAERLARLAES